MTTTKERPAGKKTAEEEVAALRSRRQQRKEQAPRGAYAELADPQYVQEREASRENLRQTLDLVLKAQYVHPAKLAEMMGLSEPAVRHRLYGRSMFTAQEVWAIAKMLGVDVNLLLDPDMPLEKKVRAIKKAASAADTQVDA